jgi:hypothetical protein
VSLLVLLGDLLSPRRRRIDPRHALVVGTGPKAPFRQRACDRGAIRTPARTSAEVNPSHLDLSDGRRRRHRSRSKCLGDLDGGQRRLRIADESTASCDSGNLTDSESDFLVPLGLW